MAYEYYSSPKDSARAIAFRKAYANAPPGETLWFEGQPYAKPAGPGFLAPDSKYPEQMRKDLRIEPGAVISEEEAQEYQNMMRLNAEEGPGTMTGYKPIERMNPNDQAYMPPEMRARIAAEEAERMRYGERIGGRSKVLREGAYITPSGYVDPTMRSQQWMEPEGSFAQSPHALDSLENQGIRDRWASDPYNAPRFASTNQRGVAEGFTHGMSGPGSDVTGRYRQSGGEGLLSDQSSPMVDRGWIDNPAPTQQPLLASSSGVDKSGTTDRSGWEKNKVMWDLIRMGLSNGDSWEPGVEY